MFENDIAIYLDLAESDEEEGGTDSESQEETDSCNCTNQ